MEGMNFASENADRGPSEFLLFLLSRWDEDEVNRRLERVMVEAFHSVWDIHKERNTPLRTAAFTLALQRVTRAHLHRGFD